MWENGRGFLLIIILVIALLALPGVIVWVCLLFGG